MKLMEISKVKKDGTYIGVRLDKKSLDKIEKFIKDNNIKNATPREDIHITLVYSRKIVPNAKKLINTQINNEPAKPTGKFDCWGEEENSLVMLVESDYLQKRFKMFESKGAIFGFDSYTPHITLTYDAQLTDKNIIKNLKWDGGDLFLLKEYHEDLDLDWNDNDES
jgi:2'-5' RNA ligase